MNILLKNMSNTLNYGSMMMGENLISEMTKRTDVQLNFYIDTENQVHVERLRKATGYQRIFSDTQSSINLITKNIRVVRYFEKRLRNSSILKRLTKFYQAVIILGGDDYAETYFNFPKDNLLFSSIFNDIRKLSEMIPVYMISQSIGPFSSERETLVSQCFSKVKIYSRDPVSHQYVTEKLGLVSHFSADLAFLDLNLEKEFASRQNEILNDYGLIENEYFVIVGTGLISHYSKNQELFVSKFYEIIKMIRHNFPDKKLVYLSHVVNQDTIYHDTRLLNLLKEVDSDFISKHLIEITLPMLPVEARMILGGSKLNISCRMHAVVSSLHMNAPAIALSYSKKYRGVISEGMNLSELVIESKGDDVWSGPIDKIVQQKMEEILENESQLKLKIKEKVNENIQKASRMMDEVVKDLAE